MGVIRGRERDCRQEVRGAVERGGTRPTRRADPQRQAFRPAADDPEIHGALPTAPMPPLHLHGEMM
jgi:hypothetical protein